MRHVLLLLSVLLVSCGSDSYITKDRIVYITENQMFEGIYYFDHGGYLELTVNEDNLVTVVREGQSLTSVNPQNDTYAQHPTFYQTRLRNSNGILRFTQNANYTTGQDIEDDVTGGNITGTRRTDYDIRMVNGLLQLTINIYSDAMYSNANYIVARRVFTEI